VTHEITVSRDGVEVGGEWKLLGDCGLEGMERAEEEERGDEGTLKERSVEGKVKKIKRWLKKNVFES
jgi:hypothetical protein